MIINQQFFNQQFFSNYLKKVDVGSNGSRPSKKKNSKIWFGTEESDVQKVDAEAFASTEKESITPKAKINQPSKYGNFSALFCPSIYVSQTQDTHEEELGEEVFAVNIGDSQYKSSFKYISPYRLYLLI